MKYYENDWRISFPEISAISFQGGFFLFFELRLKSAPGIFHSKQYELCNSVNSEQ